MKEDELKATAKNLKGRASEAARAVAPRAERDAKPIGNEGVESVAGDADLDFEIEESEDE